VPAAQQQGVPAAQQQAAQQQGVLVVQQQAGGAGGAPAAGGAAAAATAGAQVPAAQQQAAQQHRVLAALQHQQQAALQQHAALQQQQALQQAALQQQVAQQQAMLAAPQQMALQQQGMLAALQQQASALRPAGSAKAATVGELRQQQQHSNKVRGVTGKGKGGEGASKVCWPCTSKGKHLDKQAAMRTGALPDSTRLVIMDSSHQKGLTCPFCKRGDCKKDMRYRHDAEVPNGFPDLPRCGGH
jgi:hypothetical protein